MGNGAGGGGGRQLVPEGGISYEWGGRPPPPRAYAGSGAVQKDTSLARVELPNKGTNVVVIHESVIMLCWG